MSETLSKEPSELSREVQIRRRLQRPAGGVSDRARSSRRPGAGDVRCRALEPSGSALPPAPTTACSATWSAPATTRSAPDDIAVAPEHRGTGAPGGCCAGPDRGVAGEPAVHARGPGLPTTGDRDVRTLRLRSAGVRPRYYHDNGEDALICGWTEGASGCAGDRDSWRRHLRRHPDGPRILSNLIPRRPPPTRAWRRGPEVAARITRVTARWSRRRCRRRG